MNAICNLYDRLVSGLSRLRWFMPLLTRLTLAGVFIESGWGKLHNLPKVIGFFESLGIPYPQLQAPFVASVEFICGVLILLGCLTRLASIPLIGTMVVAILTAKRSEIGEFTDLFGFSEYLYIILLLWLIFEGAGRVSLDAFFRQLRDRKVR